MRSWHACALTALLAAAIVPLIQQRASAGGEVPPAASETNAAVDGKATPSASPSASGITSASSAPAASFAPSAPASPLANIEWTHLQFGQDEVTARGPGTRIAHLTLNPQLQQTAAKLLHDLGAPEAAVVLLEVPTGRALVWAAEREQAVAPGLCTKADAPAASIFKIVTAAALVEHAGLKADTRQCYSGGETRIVAADLVDDPKRDRWCATLAEAMGRSLNVVFARLALRSLKPPQLEATAKAFGFGVPLPFDWRVDESEVHLPEDDLGFARTAAGFWNTSLSPVHGAVIASTIANGGQTVRPVLVDSVTDKAAVLYRAPSRQMHRRAVRQETADAITQMMETTVSGGTSYRAFHDNEGRPFLPNVPVAGKTGTLSRPKSQEFFTWFVGFAPSRAPEVAIAVEVVNGPKWRAKANVVAREVLQAYFARRRPAVAAQE